MDLGLKDKAAIITGINNPQGIGANTAFALAREGVKLVLVYKKIPREYDEGKTDRDGLDRYFKANSGNAAEVEEKLRSMSADFLVIEGDISNEQSVKTIFDHAIERFGKVDILVNNAAFGDELGNDTIEIITHKLIDETFAVNVNGTLLMTREFIRQHGDYGRIINISTDAAQVFAGQITYGASKAAVEALTRSIAMEVGKYGITVNCVAPGPTQTGWIDEELAKAVIPQIPLGKLIQPEEIADTIVFLASERSAMVTGQVVKVSGGHAL
jgi:3-oxoacyl-[acyl-carrier protein] reductase